MLPHSFLEEAMGIFFYLLLERGKPQCPALLDLFLKYALVLGSDQNLVHFLCSPLPGKVVQSTNYLICKSGHAAAVEEFFHIEHVSASLDGNVFQLSHFPVKCALTG